MTWVEPDKWYAQLASFHAAAALFGKALWSAEQLVATTFQLPVQPGMSEAVLGWVADRIRVLAEGQLP
jgi:hypothetical protein